MAFLGNERFSDQITTKTSVSILCDVRIFLFIFIDQIYIYNAVSYSEQYAVYDYLVCYAH